MNYILSCTFPFLKYHLRHDKETGADLRPAVVSGIITGDAPVNYWPIFSPVLWKGARILLLFPPVLKWRIDLFLNSCKQRHQPKAWVDKIHWFVWNCSPERQPQFFMFTHWSEVREGGLLSFVCSAKVWFYFGPTWATLLLMRCFHLFRRAWVLVWVVRAWKTWSEWLLLWGE